MKTELKLPILLVLGLLMCFSGASPVFSADHATEPDEKYTFTSDWFTHDIPNWTRILNGMKGKPGLTYLEIGAWEGRSFFWVLDNILTHPSSKAIAIDIFEGDVEQRFLDNVRRSGHSSKITVIKGFSQQKLRDLKLNSIDLIYIDGDHRSRGVLTDAILSWELLKDGGILIFDDYKLASDLPMEMRPEFAIDVFQTLFRDEFQILINDYQFIVRKTNVHCNEAMGFIKRLDNSLFCSRLGPYVYYWKPRKFYNISTNREVALSEGETSLIENTLIHLRLGFRLQVEKKETDLYRNFFSKLGISEISVSPRGE